MSISLIELITRECVWWADSNLLATFYFNFKLKETFINLRSQTFFSRYGFPIFSELSFFEEEFTPPTQSLIKGSRHF